VADGLVTIGFYSSSATANLVPFDPARIVDIEFSAIGTDVTADC